MAFHFQPIFHTPLTDIVGSVGHYQFYGRCADFEMSMMNCMEAYGALQAKTKCKDIIDDFTECHAQRKQVRQILTHMYRYLQGVAFIDYVR